MTDLRNTREFKQGRLYARKLKTYLIGRGNGVVLASDDGAFAPMFEAIGHSFRLPDLQVHWRGEYEWWEVKWKQHASFFERAGVRTTGADRVCLMDYREVERWTLRPVRVVFLHEDENEVLLGRLSDFDPGLSVGNGGSRGEKLDYCAADRLEWLCSYQDIHDARAARLEPQQPWLIQPVQPKKAVPGIQLAFELPTRVPPVGVKGWLRP